jgi:DNA-binding transcriptional LysR family regulator
MDIRTLKYFIAVYEEESVSAAAKRCFVAQPSISTTVSQMEESLGVNLFLRHRKGVTPTPEAHLFYKSAINIVGEFSALQELFKNTEEPQPLTLAIMPTIDSGKIGEFIKRVCAGSDKILLRLVDLGEHADARVVSEQLRKKGERFLPLWSEKYVLALPQGHRLSLQPAIALHDLDGIRIIERCHCELNDEVSIFLRKYHINPLTVAHATNEEWAVAMVAAGLGVAIVPESSVRNRDNVVTKPLRELKLVRKVGFAYDPATSSSTAVKLILDDLKVPGKR